MVNPGPVADGRLEDNALIVAFAMSLGLDAIVASWPFLSALDATLATRETAGLGPLAKLWIDGSGFIRGVSRAGRDVRSGHLSCNGRQVASLDPLKLGFEACR